MSGPRITPEDVAAAIASEHYFTAGDGVTGANGGEGPHVYPSSLDLLTFCVLVMRNGHRVVGVNYGAIDPAQHSAEMGQREARKQAVDKVYEFLGYELRSKLST